MNIYSVVLISLMERQNIKYREFVEMINDELLDVETFEILHKIELRILIGSCMRARFQFGIKI